MAMLGRRRGLVPCCLLVACCRQSDDRNRCSIGKGRMGWVSLVDCLAVAWIYAGQWNGASLTRRHETGLVGAPVLGICDRIYSNCRWAQSVCRKTWERKLFEGMEVCESRVAVCAHVLRLSLLFGFGRKVGR